jgi:hypothetical protein
MTEQSETNTPDWPEVLQRINRELATLSKVERSWLREHIAIIEVTQFALDKLFCKAGGVALKRIGDGQLLSSSENVPE